jgi:hypothetical protein
MVMGALGNRRIERKKCQQLFGARINRNFPQQQWAIDIAGRAFCRILHADKGSKAVKLTGLLPRENIHIMLNSSVLTETDRLEKLISILAGSVVTVEDDSGGEIPLIVVEEELRQKCSINFAVDFHIKPAKAPAKSGIEF